MFFSLGSFVADFASILIDFTSLYYRRRCDISTLCTVAKCMIGKDTSEHSFGDRRRPNTHAGIVPSGGFDKHCLAAGVDRPARQADAGGGLERERDRDILSGR